MSLTRGAGWTALVFAALLLLLGIPLWHDQQAKADEGRATNDQMRQCQAAGTCTSTVPGMTVQDQIDHNEAVIAAAIGMRDLGIGLVVFGGVLGLVGVVGLVRATSPPAPKPVPQPTPSPPAAAAPAADDVRYVRHACGALIREHDAFCMTCGRPVSKAEPARAKADGDDPLAVLRMRLAKGEISVQEFQAARAAMDL